MNTAYAEMMFAHQGGWDEALYALVPIAVIFGLLWLANTRAKKLQDSKVTDPVESD